MAMGSTDEDDGDRDIRKRRPSEQQQLLRAYRKLFGKKSEASEREDEDTDTTDTTRSGWERNPLFDAYRKLFHGRETTTAQPAERPAERPAGEGSKTGEKAVSAPTAEELAIAKALAAEAPPPPPATEDAAGAKTAEEDREEYNKRLDELRSYGYDVSTLEPLLENDPDAFKRGFETMVEQIFRSKILSHRFEAHRSKMTADEIEFFEEKKDLPAAYAEIEWMLTEIEARECAPADAEEKETAAASQPQPSPPARTAETGMAPSGAHRAAHPPTGPRAGPAAYAGERAPSRPIDPYALTPGMSYLIERERPDDCFTAYAKLLSSGMDGVCITRTNPKVVRKKFGMKDTPIKWLTDRNTATEPTISSELEFLFNELEMFITLHPEGVILLDGLEYLISNNDFRKIQRFVRELVDEISEHEALLIIPVSPYAVETKNLKVLEREMEIC